MDAAYPGATATNAWKRAVFSRIVGLKQKRGRMIAAPCRTLSAYDAIFRLRLGAESTTLRASCHSRMLITTSHGSFPLRL